MDRLFVPLNRVWYNLFAEGRKTWEIRASSPRFNEKTVRVDRRVELRLGYQKAGALWGTIREFEISASIYKLSDRALDGAIPPCRSIEQLAELRAYDRKYSSFIAFKVELDEIPDA